MLMGGCDSQSGREATLDPDGIPGKDAATVPGTVEAEDFDAGGQGVAYHDMTPGNAGGQYRLAEDVDIFVSDADAGALVVGDFESGEWLAFTINVPTTGSYDLGIRAGSDTGNAAFHVEVDDQDASGSVPIPDTGDTAALQWIEVPAIWLAAGERKLAIFSEGDAFNFDSLRVLRAPSAEIGSLLFRSGFEGDVRLDSPSECFDTGCWQRIVGTDTDSGFSWPPAAFSGEMLLQLLADAPVSAATVGTFIDNGIRTVTGHDGQETQALYMEIRESGCCGIDPQGSGATQDSLQLLPARSPGDIYISFWIRFQPDLDERMAAETWRAFFNMKTGTPGLDDGDYRIAAYVRTDQGSDELHWSCEGDNSAGGDYPLMNDWLIGNVDVPVPVGEWFKFEVFVHRSSAVDGRVWKAINGTVICDHRGPNTGAGSLPINRIMMPTVYSGSPYPIFQWVDDIQIWSGFPTADDDPPYAPH